MYVVFSEAKKYCIQKFLMFLDTSLKMQLIGKYTEQITNEKLSIVKAVRANWFLLDFWHAVQHLTEQINLISFAYSAHFPLSFLFSFLSCFFHCFSLSFIRLIYLEYFLYHKHY